MDETQIAEIAGWVAIVGLPVAIGVGILADEMQYGTVERRILDAFSTVCGFAGIAAILWSLFGVDWDEDVLSQEIFRYVLAGVFVLGGIGVALLAIGAIFQGHIGPALSPFLERLRSLDKKSRRDAFFTLVTLFLGLVLIGVFFANGGEGFPIFGAFLIVAGLIRLFRPQINDD